MPKTVSDFRNFALLEDVGYGALDGTNYILTKGAQSDLASTPPEVWGLPLFLIPNGWYALPAFGHDCAYRNTLFILEPDGMRSVANLPKDKCDQLLLEMMQTLKPNPTPAEEAQMKAIYEGVALGGWHAYKTDR